MSFRRIRPQSGRGRTLAMRYGSMWQDRPAINIPISKAKSPPAMLINLCAQREFDLKPTDRVILELDEENQRIGLRLATGKEHNESFILGSRGFRGKESGRTVVAEGPLSLMCAEAREMLRPWAGKTFPLTREGGMLVASLA